MRLLSWIKPNNYRRFRAGSLFIPRQNGKSFFASSLALYFLMADREQGAFVSISACTGSQTRVVFDEVANSVRQSPALLKSTKINRSTSEIVYRRTNSVLRGLTSSGPSKLGNPPHLAIFDEFCFYPPTGYKAYEALKTGMDSRNQPLLFCISTSGTDRSTPGYETWSYANAINDSAVVDTAFCGFVYAAPDDTPDIHDPKVWQKCNPSLGFSVPMAETKAWSDRARISKIEELQLRQYRLNQWTTGVKQFLNLDAFHACSSSEWPDLTGKVAYVGIDLSCTVDLTAVVAVIPHEGKFYVDHHSFCCRTGVNQREKANLIKYTLFEKEGVMTIHEGNCVDYDDVRAYCRKLALKYQVNVFAFDPTRNAADTLITLSAEGYPCEQYRQGPLYFNAPMRRLSELVLDRKIVHKGDSLILWQAQNLEGEPDRRDMVAPEKPHEAAKIDTMVAMIMGLAKAIEGQATPAKVVDNVIEFW